MESFIGRKQELARLELLLKKKAASFVVIRGRRRIGKSRLIEEFAKSTRAHIFSGLPITDQTTRQGQLDEFARQVARAFDLPPFSVGDWGEMFWHMSKRCTKGHLLIALDEVSWIGSKDPDFLGQLKNAWDLYFSKNPKLIMIVCGSVSSWIEKNILSSSGFVGRISLDLQLEELPLHQVSKFWGPRRKHISSYEIFKVLSVTGGVPRYLEEIQPQLSAEDNVQMLCFKKGGLLYGEFDRIFSDLFSSRAHTYAAIARALAERPLFLDQVAASIDKAKSTTSPYLNDLIHAGFVSADPTWNLTTMRSSPLRSYRLSDNYLRFYLKYILPNKEGMVDDLPLGQLPHWESVMGLQFENLVLHNVRELLGAMGVAPSSVARYGPYFQRATKRMAGCQVDLLIQSRHRTLFLCEVKFSTDKVGMSTIREMQIKQQRISIPRGWSTRLVLIHVNGVTGEALGADALDHIIDFSDLLEKD